MPFFDFSVDECISVHEFLEACNSSEKEDLIESLIEDGYLKKNCRPVSNELYSAPESMYEEALQKLNGKWNMLTREEEELILKIANRF